jgi:hypothetical protein
MKKELLYPFFIDCCELTNDKFWKGVFEDLAYGIAPYGAYVSKGAIMCNYKDKEFMYRISKKEPQELYSEIFNLFTNKLNIMSKEQILQRKENVERVQEEAVDWSSIKKKNFKDVLIENWAISMKNKHNLTLKQTKYLISIIFLGLIFKIFTSKDIIVKNGVIEEIKGISFEHCKIHIERDIYDIQAISSPDIVTEKLNMSDEWEKYLNTLQKN